LNGFYTFHTCCTSCNSPEEVIENEAEVELHKTNNLLKKIKEISSDETIDEINRLRMINELLS